MDTTADILGSSSGLGFYILLFREKVMRNSQVLMHVAHAQISFHNLTFNIYFYIYIYIFGFDLHVTRASSAARNLCPAKK